MRPLIRLLHASQAPTKPRPARLPRSLTFSSPRLFLAPRPRVSMYTVHTQHHHQQPSMSRSSTPAGTPSQRQAPAGVQEFVRLVRKTFERSANYAAYAKASILSATAPTLTIEYTAVQRDFERDAKRKLSNYLVVDTTEGRPPAVVARGAPSDISEVKMQARAPSDPELLVVLRSISGGSKRFVEVWRNGSLEKCIDVGDKHGEFYGDSTFGTMAWSDDAKFVAYTAEHPEYEKAKTDSQRLAEESDEPDGLGSGRFADDFEGSLAGAADPRRYEFESDWGETFSGKRPPTIVVFDVEGGSIRVHEMLDDVSPGQLGFLPTAEGPRQIAFTGYKYKPRKHGIVYCQNRPTGIYIADIESMNPACIATGSVRSPRVTPSGSGIVYLSTAIGGPHAATSEIKYYDLKTRETCTVVPKIDAPVEKGSTVIGGCSVPVGFVGLYVNQLPEAPWVVSKGRSNKHLMAFTSTWRSTNVVLVLDIEDKKLSLCSPIDNSCSYAVLSASGSTIVATRSTPAMPSVLEIGEVGLNGDSVDIGWSQIEKCSPDEDIGFEVVRSKEGVPESILVYPAKPTPKTRYFWKDDATARPLVVQPHGGPHSAYTLDYSPMAAGLARLGFSVLLINFTGSLGFGDESVQKQIGNMATLTLDEIQESATSMHRSGFADPKTTVYLGGSYSGYTGALLAGKLPGFYKAIVLRNPVISVGENAAMSDIPDWCWAELGLEYDFENPPEITPEAYRKMWEVSPSRYAENVKDPLMLMLGNGDRRVPMQQSLAYYYRLKAEGAPVKCKVYPGVGHPLDTVEAERDSFISIVRFYAAALSKEHN